MPDLKNLPAVEPQIAALANQLRPVFEQAPETVLIGVFTGGVWLCCTENHGDLPLFDRHCCCYCPWHERQPD